MNKIFQRKGKGANMTDTKNRYFHYEKPYELAGKIPEAGMAEVKKFLIDLCEGIPGVGCFGTGGAHTMKNGAIDFDLRLFALRMRYNKKAQEMVTEISEKYDTPWLKHLLLEKEPEDNLFIISPDGEVWSIIW
jgi:hypothetical protein